MRSNKSSARYLNTVQINLLRNIAATLTTIQELNSDIITDCIELEREYKNNPRSVKDGLTALRNMFEGKAFRYVNKQSKGLIRKMSRSLKADDRLKRRLTENISQPPSNLH